MKGYTLCHMVWLLLLLQDKQNQLSRQSSQDTMSNWTTLNTYAMIWCIMYPDYQAHKTLVLAPHRPSKILCSITCRFSGQSSSKWQGPTGRHGLNKVGVFPNNKSPPHSTFCSPSGVLKVTVNAMHLNWLATRLWGAPNPNALIWLGALMEILPPRRACGATALIVIAISSIDELLSKFLWSLVRRCCACSAIGRPLRSVLRGPWSQINKALART